MKLINNLDGNYRFLTGIAPYSAGVVAMPSYEITHTTMRQPVPYRVGFELIAEHLAQRGRSRKALCAIELRSPRPFTFGGFTEFNNSYQDLLDDWGLMVNGRNPIARTNIAPSVCPPDEPSLYGFAYTIPVSDVETSTFVVAGAGDLRDQADLSEQAIVRPGETSVAALQEKVSVVMDVMQERLFGLGMAWSNVTVINVYTTQSIHPILEVEILARVREAARHGIHWHYSHPPIEGLLFEMDLRGVRQELWI